MKENDNEKYQVEVDNKGIVVWYKFGTNKLHREDGPAVEYPNGNKQWYLNGKLHREDGPAVELVNGRKYWWIHGERLSEKQFLARQNPLCDDKIVEIDGKQYKLTAV